MLVKTEIEQRVAQVGFDYDRQPKQVQTTCNLSGDEAHTIITHRDRYGFNVQACFWHKSGLITLNPRLTAEAYVEFYQKYYRPLVSAYHGRLIDAQSIQAEQQEYAKDLVDFIAPFIQDKGWAQPFSLLDIGGSTGIVALEFVKRLECQATILDPAPDELVFAQQFGMNCITGFIEDSEDKLADGYDFIMICQTIDHLLDVYQTLTAVKRILKPDGLFYVDLVDFLSVGERLGALEQSIKVDHPYYFTCSTLEAYLKRVGFAPVEKIQINEKVIGYICKHSEPDSDFLPSAEEIEATWKKVQSLANQTY